jgi:hypothetical protein
MLRAYLTTRTALIFTSPGISSVTVYYTLIIYATYPNITLGEDLAGIREMLAPKEVFELLVQKLCSHPPSMQYPRL